MKARVINTLLSTNVNVGDIIEVVKCTCSPTCNLYTEDGDINKCYTKDQLQFLDIIEKKNHLPQWF